VWLGVSQIGTPALARVAQGLFGKVVQSSRRNIGFHLVIPHLGVKLRKPSPQSLQFRGWKSSNGFYDFFHGTHDRIIPSGVLILQGIRRRLCPTRR